VYVGPLPPLRRHGGSVPHSGLGLSLAHSVKPADSFVVGVCSSRHFSQGIVSPWFCPGAGSPAAARYDCALGTIGRQTSFAIKRGPLVNGRPVPSRCRLASSGRSRTPSNFLPRPFELPLQISRGSSMILARRRVRACSGSPPSSKTLGTRHDETAKARGVGRSPTQLTRCGTSASARRPARLHHEVLRGKSEMTRYMVDRRRSGQRLTSHTSRRIPLDGADAPMTSILEACRREIRPAANENGHLS